MFVRDIDALGRLCIPKECRDYLGIEKGERASMELEFGVDSILIRRAKDHCSVCGGHDSLVWMDDGTPVCRTCVKKIKNFSFDD